VLNYLYLAHITNDWGHLIITDVSIVCLLVRYVRIVVLKLGAVLLHTYYWHLYIMGK